jgi:hypothetical protein
MFIDERRCHSQCSSNNFFDFVTFISNGEAYLFDASAFYGFLVNCLNFWCICREC